MTVTTTANSIQYAGNGVTTAFAFPYIFFEPTDLVVVLVDAGINVTPPPVLNGAATYDYTVTGVFTDGEYASGATVTFNTAPLTGYTVSLLRAVPAIQTVDLVDNSKFPADTVNTEFDYLTVLLQDQASRMTISNQLALHIPGNEFGLTTLASPNTTRRQRVLAWDGSGNLTQSTKTLAEIEAGAPSPGTPTAGLVNVLDWGAVGDGVADDTLAIQAALGTGHAIFLPKGNYRVTDALVVPYGSGIFGETKQFSRIVVPVTFNLSAAGVLVITPPVDFWDSNSATVKDLTIAFDQPDTAVRASLVQYPPAIFARNANRIVVENIRIVRGWSGIWMDGGTPSGSTGGNWIDGLEASCFSKAIYMEDCLDVQHISRIHLWDFGLTTNQQTVFKDGNTIGLEAGRVDTLHVTDFFAIYIPKAIWLRTGTGNFPGLSFGQLENIVLDDSGLVIANGTWNVSNLYTAPGPVTARTLIVTPDAAAACLVNISSLFHRILSVHASGTAETMFVGSGSIGSASLTVSSMTCVCDTFDRSVIAVQNGAAGVSVLNITGAFLIRDGNTASTKPAIHIKSGRGSFSNISINDKDTSTADLIRIDTDDWITISNVLSLGWGVTLPANARFIDHNIYAVRQTYTPTVTSQTGTLTTASATGRYTIRGKFCKLQLKVTVTTNGTGATAIVVTLPPNVTSAATEQILAGREVASTGTMLQGLIGSGALHCFISTYANAYPAADGRTLIVDGEFEIQ